MENKMDLTFSGAGFMGCYYFGIVDCWNKYIPRDRVNRVAGASAGSLTAAYYLMNLPIEVCIKEIIGLTEDIRRRPLGVFDRKNQIVDILPKVLDRLFPDDAHKQVSGRLHVCMTRLKDMKKIIVNEFETRKDLIDALNCSCFIPVWSGNHVSTYKGVKHIDGGFSDNLPVFDEHTIRICCFSGASDISPYDRAKMELLSGTVLNTPLYLNFANCRRFRKALFPPPASFIIDLLEQGFHDAKNFILSNDLIQCDSCYKKTSLQDQLIYQRISPTITPSVSPALSRSGSYRKLTPKADSINVHHDENNNNIEIRKKNKNIIKNFNNLVSEKLRTYSPESTGSNNTHHTKEPLPAPMIVINDSASSGHESGDNFSTSADDSDGSDGDSISKTNKYGSNNDTVGELKKNKRKEKLPASGEKQQLPIYGRRRSTLQDSDKTNLLIMEDKFTLAPDPLPSCPPSPNLNRHCTECIRLRQEARMDTVEKEIRMVAEQFRGEIQPIKEGGLRDKLTSPIRWLRQLGTVSSYRFQDSPGNDTKSSSDPPSL